MTRILVTGGAGFIGSRVVHAALARGWDVRVLDALRVDVHPQAPVLADAVEFVRADVRDREAMEDALAGVDVVCHQAAKVGLGVDFDDAPDYSEVNVVGTAVVLAAMRARRVGRLVLASSMVVYGEGAYHLPGASTAVRPAPRLIRDLEAGVFDPRDPATGAVLVPGSIDETGATDPRNVYALTKLAQEHLAASWVRETGGSAALLRYHNVYGAGMPRDTPYAGVAAIFRSALARGEAPRVFEDGRQRRDFIHVDDVAAANLAAAEWTAAVGATARPFNIATGRVTTVHGLASALADAMHGPDPVVTGEYRAGDVRHITASADRAHRELGWRAEVDLGAGLAGFAAEHTG
ncbi:NAD-dependent epimerase/dehydratase family protein [Microbacterium thalassium]|uniref:UDP-glucose 4-epimerase n=1 Tax=Microbacterium thalassium TaxID=362649 RepID=A0A7X0FQS6_9MICO|nr:NAD-dependent epimerase/dehydratase family protein [Microbacterium thalassium]MBB6391993.1 dTDP-L-rhamnose 4-epimerase [Microbacterium thalassium]GLK24013.1 NAD-dependent dehydratase [Microbacterium thalassium]